MKKAFNWNTDQRSICSTAIKRAQKKHTQPTDCSTRTIEWSAGNS